MEGLVSSPSSLMAMDPVVFAVSSELSLCDVSDVFKAITSLCLRVLKLFQ